MERNIINGCIWNGMTNEVAKGKGVGRVSIAIDSLLSSFIKHYPKYKSKQINKVN